MRLRLQIDEKGENTAQAMCYERKESTLEAVATRRIPKDALKSQGKMPLWPVRTAGGALTTNAVPS
jgi:hypothetical protein